MTPEYIQKWVGYLNDIDRDMILIACQKLGKTKDKSVVPELAKALRNRPNDIRAAAARALGQVGDDSAITALVQALDDPDPMVSAAAAEALGEIGSDRAVPPLRQILHDYKEGNDRHHQLHGESRGLYMAAVYALQMINTREARAAIERYHRW